jgi:chromosome segregation ATPase
MDKLERNAEEAVRQRADLKLELSRCNESLAATATHWRSANELLTDLRERVDLARRKSYEARHEREAHTVRLESMRHQVSTTVRSLRRLNEEGARLAEESEAVARSLANREAEVSRHAGLVAELETRTLYRGRQADTIRSSRRPATDQTSVMRAARASLSQAIADDERRRLLLSQAEQARAQLGAEIEAETGQSASVLQPSHDAVPPAEEIKRLRSRTTQYADADASVVTESAELANRSAYLRNHVEDLRTAADTLRAIMNTADREMHDRFQVAFDAVNTEFSRVFEVMLRGGQGCLKQVEADSGSRSTRICRGDAAERVLPSPEAKGRWSLHHCSSAC